MLAIVPAIALCHQLKCQRKEKGNDGSGPWVKQFWLHQPPPQRASEGPKAHRTQISGASWSAPEPRRELESQVCLQGQSDVPATAEPDHYGVHNPDCHDYSLESPALSGWNLSLCSAGTVTPSQLGVLPSGRRGRAAHLNQTGPREPLSPSIREERGGGNSEAPQCLPAHWTDRTSYSSQALTSEPKGGGAWEPGQPQQIQ